ncbi:MAG TPA: replication protein RepA [Rhodopila sp.]|nr:replication protein RepA [Rhodopila sp.]
MNSPAAPNGIHQLVLLHGREQARSMVPANQRSLVDIAAEVLADESQRIGISYTGFCLTSLPHKRLPDDQTWEKKGHRVTLWVEPGRMKYRGKVVNYGVPYGARARMILLYLQTQAVRTGSREIELGRSMRDWMERMGLAIGGETAKSLREQAARISACTLKFFWENDEQEGWARGGIVTSGLRFKVPESDQGSLWEDRVVLDEVFWRSLKEHPVPLLEAAIRQLRDRSMSLDIYVWLAWRCHQLGKPTTISWPAIFAQFGGGFRAMKHFKPSFIEAMGAALAAYPQARVDVEDGGITVHPSRPPVPRLTVG